MKLQDCILDIDKAVVSEAEILGLDEKWQAARERTVIPESLYRLYCQADYFAFGKAPRYLSDHRKLLFPFLEGMTRGIRDSLSESKGLVKELPELHARSYSPVKKGAGEKWDPEAADRLIQSFKYLLVNLTGALDQFAEITGVLFHPELKDVSVGRALFKQLVKFAKGSTKASGVIVCPKGYLVEKLRTILAKEIDSSPPEKDWLDLLFLYRNKLAHLGTSAFQYMNFHDEDMQFYTFLPRHWPYFHKQRIEEALRPDASQIVPFKQLAEDQLVHCDICEYSQGLFNKVFRLLDAGVVVICEAYKMLADFEPNEDAATALMRQSKAYDFKEFVDS